MSTDESDKSKQEGVAGSAAEETAARVEARLVRGADGDLYLITRHMPPFQLPPEISEAFNRTLEQAEEDLTGIIQEANRGHLGGTQFVKFPDIIAVPN